MILLKNRKINMYTLGIDTTFHTTGVALIDKSNKVKFNQRIKIDFSNQEADKFFNSHLKNLMNLFSKIDSKIWNKIDLISVVNKEGAFHSLPVGVAFAAGLACAKNKKIIGVNHEIAHLYSVWLERQPNEFKFPIVSLSASGAHSAIYYQKNHRQIKKIASLYWEKQNNSFQGIAALFDNFCNQLKIKINTGTGGVIISSLAKKGSHLEFPELNQIKIKDKGKNIIISNIDKVIKNIYSNYKKELFQKEFQQNLAFNFLNHFFGLLSQKFIQLAKIKKAKEIHLVGGVAANNIFQKATKRMAQKNGIDFKTPIKKEFCKDNAAMVAVRGKYKSAFSKRQNFILVAPSPWYYRYYYKNYLKKSGK